MNTTKSPARAEQDRPAPAPQTSAADPASGAIVTELAYMGRKVVFRSMDDALKNGNRIAVLKPDKATVVNAYWHTTREFDAETGGWKPKAFWAFDTPRGRPLDFEPAGWARIHW